MPADEQVNIQAATVKLPQFWAENPRLWFSQAESQFALRAVSSSRTKYYHVVAALPLAVAGRVLHLIEQVPEGDEPYELLKEALVAAYSLTEYQKAEALFKLPPLGTATPGEMLSQIKALLPPSHDKKCFLVRHMFLSRLPENVRTILLRDGSASLDELAASAETLMSAQPQSSFSTPSFSVEELEARVDAVARRFPPPRRSAAPPPRRRVRSPPRRVMLDGQELPPLCWYHRTFGDAATKCRHSDEYPCSASGNGHTGGRQ